MSSVENFRDNPFMLSGMGVIYNTVHASPILPLLPPLPNGPMKGHLDFYQGLFPS